MHEQQMRSPGAQLVEGVSEFVFNVPGHQQLRLYGDGLWLSLILQTGGAGGSNSRPWCSRGTVFCL